MGHNVEAGNTGEKNSFCLSIHRLGGLCVDTGHKPGLSSDEPAVRQNDASVSGIVVGERTATHHSQNGDHQSDGCGWFGSRWLE